MGTLGLHFHTAPALRVARSLLFILTVLLISGGLALIVAPIPILSSILASAGLPGTDVLCFIARGFGPVAISVAYLCATVRSLDDRELITIFSLKSRTA